MKKDLYYPVFKYGIKEIKKTSLLKYFSQEERNIRIQLAACYRLFHLFQWDDSIYGHLTCRIPQTEHFLINPFGLLYSEINASSLVKIDVNGNIIHPGNTEFGINKAGFEIHSLIHKNTKYQAIFHCHQRDAVAISCNEFKPITQTSHTIYKYISYSNYYGININYETTKNILENLNKILILRNHGVLTCGNDCSDAFFLMFSFLSSCQIQTRIQQIELLKLPKEEYIHKSFEIAQNLNQEGFGRREFCAYLRYLDKYQKDYKI